MAAGEEDAPFRGMPFQDSDVYKWLEAVAYALHHRSDPELRRLADGVVDLIARAQREDGYLDTFFQIKEHDRVFKRIQQSHELYVMGHYIEAAVAYWQATGNEKALGVARRMAACIEENFGDGETQIHGADGHPEIELALACLAEATGEERYAAMGRWFLNVRGQDPDFYDEQNRADGWDRDFFAVIRDFPRTYYQAAEPIADQRDADGHAVRVTYLCTGLAHIARLTGDASLAESAERLWDSIVRRRMYITGQIGSTHVGESFTYDYDLPNDTMYGETCASVGMSFFARQMLAMKARGEYGDVLEKELFNGTLAGMSLDGTHFYYVNPLEADPCGLQGHPGQGPCAHAPRRLVCLRLLPGEPGASDHFDRPLHLHGYGRRHDPGAPVHRLKGRVPEWREDRAGRRLPVGRRDHVARGQPDGPGRAFRRAYTRLVGRFVRAACGRRAGPP